MRKTRFKTKYENIHKQRTERKKIKLIQFREDLKMENLSNTISNNLLKLL